MKTSIEWCDHSVNPIRARHIPTGKVGHYCEKIASGCTNCYSSRMQIRFGTPQFGSGQRRSEYELFLDEKKLDEVRRRKKPTRYFWCDMTDIFGDWMRPEWLSACFATMDATPWHTHILLTKRPQNVRRMWPVPRYVALFPESFAKCDLRTDKRTFYRKNVWLLTSVSDQATADAMIPELLKCRDLVPVLGVSAEPLLGPVDLTPYLGGRSYKCRCGFHRTESELVFSGGDRYSCVQCGERCDIGATLDWVIVGGESGHNARPCNLAWIRSIVSQCKAAGVPCFVKQLGANPHYTNHQGDMHACGPFRDSKGGDWNEWPLDLRVREWPKGGA